MERRQSTRWRHSPPSPPTPHPKQYWFLTPILRSAHLKKRKNHYGRRRYKAPGELNYRTLKQLFSGSHLALGIITCWNGAAPVPSYRQSRAGRPCSQSLVPLPGRQVKDGERAYPHPPPRERRPKAGDRGCGGTLRYPSPRRARQVSEAPSPPRCVPAHGSPPAHFSRRPGPGDRSFSPARGGGGGSRAAWLSGAGPRASRGPPRREPEPGPVTQGGKPKKKKKKSRVRTSGARPASSSQGRARQGRGAAPAAARLRASRRRREPRPRSPGGAQRIPAGEPGRLQRARSEASRRRPPRSAVPGLGRRVRKPHSGGRTAKEGTRLPGPGGHPASSPPWPWRRYLSPWRLARSVALPQPRAASPSARPAGRQRAGRRRRRLAAPAKRPESPRAAPGAVPPPRAAGPASHRAPGLSVRPKRRAGCRSSYPDWRPNAAHANKAPPPAICTSALV